jgi:hypothetical protein
LSTRTLTSRNNTIGDWLLEARGMPTDASRDFDIALTVLQPDGEIRPQKPSVPEATTTHPAHNTDVQSVSQDYPTPGISRLGETSIPKEVSRTRENLLRHCSAGIDNLASGMFASKVCLCLAFL